MKKIIILLFIVNSAAAQLVATVELNEKVEGICDMKKIYAILPEQKGQKEAIPSVTKEELPLKLQSDLQFLKDHPDYKGKITVNCLVNCEGKMVRCTGGPNSSNEVLEKEIMEYIKKLGDWEPARLYANRVDSELIFTFKFKKGTVSYD